jgi:hypothetical protein
MGDREKHGLSPTAAKESKQQGRHCIQDNGLPGNEQDGDYRIKDPMLRFEPVQPVAQKMQDRKEISGHKNRIDRQLNCKHAQTFGTVFFHEGGVDGLNVIALGPLNRSSVVKVGYLALFAQTVNAFDV